jgi:lysophospholipase L1-like esterase
VGYIGDSIVKGDGVIPFPTQTETLFARPSRRFINQGQNARQLSTITPTEIMVRDPNISIIAAGTNDLAISSATLAQLQGWISALAASVLGFGVRVVVGTILKSVNIAGANETTRAAYNAWLVAGGVAGVRVADPTVAPQLDDPNDLTYFSDGVHPTTAGAGVMATYYEPAQAGL